MSAFSDFSDVIDAFGGDAAFGDAIGIAHSHARTMRARNSIPADHWVSVVSAAAAASPPIAGISFEVLARLRSQLSTPPRAALPSTIEGGKS